MKCVWLGALVVASSFWKRKGELGSSRCKKSEAHLPPRDAIHLSQKLSSYSMPPRDSSVRLRAAAQVSSAISSA